MYQFNYDAFKVRVSQKMVTPEQLERYYNAGVITQAQFEECKTLIPIEE